MPPTARRHPPSAGAAHKIPTGLGPIEQTLLIPLYGRALETLKPHGLLRDPLAVHMVERLDYDFSKWDGTPSMIGATMRTLMFDQEVAAFLDVNPGGTVVEIGCGLNTRFERLDQGRAHWIEMDFPDVIALRRRFMDEGPRRTMLAADAASPSWLNVVARRGGPVCFVSEASLIYLEEPQVRDVALRLAGRFPGAWLVSDTMSRRLVATQARHDAMRYLHSSSWFRWGCDDPGALADWGMVLRRSRRFDECGPEILSRLPMDWSMMLTWFPWMVAPLLKECLVNRFELRLPPDFVPAAPAPRRARTSSVKAPAQALAKSAAKLGRKAAPKAASKAAPKAVAKASAKPAPKPAAHPAPKAPPAAKPTAQPVTSGDGAKRPAKVPAKAAGRRGGTSGRAA